jgi:hypothetical protein
MIIVPQLGWAPMPPMTPMVWAAPEENGVGVASETGFGSSFQTISEKTEGNDGRTGIGTAGWLRSTNN